MMLPHERATDAQEWRSPPAKAETSEIPTQPDAPLGWRAVAGFLVLLASPLIRHWVGGVLMNICVVGGILVAPIVSIIGWVGMVLPAREWIHQYAPTLVAFALIWFALAIIGAHAFRLDRRRIVR